MARLTTVAYQHASSEKNPNQNESTVHSLTGDILEVYKLWSSLVGIALCWCYFKNLQETGTEPNS